MKICVLAFGSPGAGQPAVALSARLAGRGHEVRLVAPMNFAKLATGRVFDFVALPLDMTEELQSEADILFSGGRSPSSAGRSNSGARRLESSRRRCSGPARASNSSSAQGEPL